MSTYTEGQVLTDEQVREMLEGVPDQALLEDIARYICQFVVLPSPEHARVLALWVLHTWCFDAARTTAYLYVHSDDPQCGKTRLIEVLETIVRNPMRAANVTPSVLFRAIDVYVPTLLLDEVDTVWSGSRNEMMRSIINAGYARGGVVWRILQMQPKPYDCYCPKLLAGIHNGFMPETILDRSIPFKLKRKEAGQQCARFNAQDVAASGEVESLLNRIETFVLKFGAAVAIQRPEAVAGISDRQNEICESLLALAVVFGCEPQARRDIKDMFAAMSKAPSALQKLLTSIRAAFGDADRIFTDDLLARIEPATNGRMLAVWLEPLGIEPEQLRIGTGNRRGYKRSSFEAAWARFGVESSAAPEAV